MLCEALEVRASLLRVLFGTSRKLLGLFCMLFHRTDERLHECSARQLSVNSPYDSWQVVVMSS
jgi:hypothetical protein